MTKADIVREGAAPGRRFRQHRVLLPGRRRGPRLRPLRRLPAARRGLRRGRRWPTPRATRRAPDGLELPPARRVAPGCTAFVGPLAQLVEQKTFNLLVDGSNPSRPTFSSIRSRRIPRLARLRVRKSRASQCAFGGLPAVRVHPHVFAMRAPTSIPASARPLTKGAFRVVAEHRSARWARVVMPTGAAEADAAERRGRIAGWHPRRRSRVRRTCEPAIFQGPPMVTAMPEAQVGDARQRLRARREAGILPGVAVQGRCRGASGTSAPAIQVPRAMAALDVVCAAGALFDHRRGAAGRCRNRRAGSEPSARHLRRWHARPGCRRCLPTWPIASHRQPRAWRRNSVAAAALVQRPAPSLRRCSWLSQPRKRACSAEQLAQAGTTDRPGPSARRPTRPTRRRLVRRRSPGRALKPEAQRGHAGAAGRSSVIRSLRSAVGAACRCRACSRAPCCALDAAGL